MQRLRQPGVLSHPGDPREATVKSVLEQTEAAARALGVQLLRVEAQGPNDFDRAFSVIARQRAGALIVLPPAGKDIPPSEKPVAPGSK